MKVKEYLVNRILELERELKQLRNEKACVSHCLELQKNKIQALNEKIEQYQMEREHIKEIITCNIIEDPYRAGIYSIDLLSNEDDFKTLLAILDIKPEDYNYHKEVTTDAENTD